MTMRITAVDTFVIDVPQRPPVAPYQSRYVATSRTGALLVRLQTDAGHTGWGEAPQLMAFHSQVPFTGQEAEQLRPLLLGRDATAIESLYADKLFADPYLASAVEMACWDLLGKLCGQPLYRLLGGPCREEVEVACCMGIRPPAEAASIARDYVSAGFGTLKMKGGRRPEEDLAMVRAIRETVGDALRLRVDPNTGYSPEVALQLARDFEPYELEYFEQPMPADLIDESARLRPLTKTPLALNESVTTLASVQEILAKRAAAVLLPDTYQCGGLWAVKLIADWSAAADVTCVFHCAHDFGLKTAAMLHVVASTPNFPLANDCTYYGLVDDIITTPFRIERGRIAVPHGPGLGVTVDLVKLRKYTVGSSAL
jgi:L-alanine-DL-glutamate epimerase-like enolase superfamily enzyme